MLNLQEEARVSEDTCSVKSKHDRKGDRDMPHLNPRQRDVFDLNKKGLNNYEIADCLGLSPRAVKHCMSELLLIYEVTNRTELAGLECSSGFDRHLPEDNVSVTIGDGQSGRSARTGRADL